MKNINLTISQETLCTIITAIKNERSNAQEDNNESAEQLLQSALDEILNQSWL